jgi:hypothetical protein
MSGTEPVPEKGKKESIFKSSNFFTDWDDGQLSADEVFTGLLDFGLFAEKVPPCFTSKGLAAIVEKEFFGLLNEENPQKLKGDIDKKSHDYIRYEALRDINIPRHLGIPHPESYAVQVLAIKKHWDEIKRHNNKPSPQASRIHVRHVGGGSIFEMNYKGSERNQLEEDEIEWRMGAQFVVKADIAACFPSIYTHSIPWAIHGKSIAKSHPGSLWSALSGNLLDKCTQNTRDKQTNGLLIGPHSSNIIAEIILTSIDVALQTKGYKKFKRHIDDYEFYADSYEQAERFLKDLGLNLRAYEMSLNEKKTRILALPRPSSENWWQALNRFIFPSSETVMFPTIRSLLDLALEHAKIAGTSVPLNYAIKILADNRGEHPILNNRTKRLYVQEAINLAMAYPYLVPVLDNHVFDRYMFDGITKKIAEFSALLIALGTKKLYPDTICHALYYALKHDVVIPVDDTSLLEILNLDDCLANVLLLEYANKHTLKKVKMAIRKRSSELLKSGDDRDNDKHWLLIYQTWTERELKGRGQQFLADLKKQGFQFIVFPVKEMELSAIKEIEISINELVPVDVDVELKI